MTSNKHPNGYTKEMIREILGTSCPEWDPTHETGNQMRKRKGREIREGKRPKPHQFTQEQLDRAPHHNILGKYYGNDWKPVPQEGLEDHY